MFKVVLCPSSKGCKSLEKDHLVCHPGCKSLDKATKDCKSSGKLRDGLLDLEILTLDKILGIQIV